jgi:hypothetical protein
MRTHRCWLAALALTLSAGVALGADVKSGPQPGEKLAGPFHPLNINGEQAGKKNCLYCSNGDRPVAMIFARECTPELTTLIKKIDAATAASKGKMGSFVVFLGKGEDLESKLKSLVKKANLKETVLAIDNPAGPEGYKVAKDADVTVVLYRQRTCKVNYAFKKGGLTDKDVSSIIASLPKIQSAE